MAWDEVKTDDVDILYASDWAGMVAAVNNKIPHSLATAVNDFLVASASGTFVKKTLAEVKTILGLGTAAALDSGTDVGNVVVVGSDGKIDSSLYNSSGSGSGIIWNEVTGTSQTAAADNGYICNNSSLVTVTLPSTIAVGKTIRIAGSGAGGWKIAQNSGQIIYFGDMNTTSGTGGYLASNNQYDGLELLCIVANTTFVVISSMGDITVV